MKGNTKEKILDAALLMFSQNGYSGTNMRELAQSLGLSKAALYKHFESKEDIWNALIEKVTRQYEENFGSKKQMPEIPDSAQKLIALTMKLADYTIHDKAIIMTRKILTIEQFRKEDARELASRHFLTDIEEMFTYIFKGMMDKNLLKKQDAQMLAFEYTAPITSMIHLCDRDPGKEPQAMEKIRAFSEHFVRTYSIR